MYEWTTCAQTHPLPTFDGHVYFITILAISFEWLYVFVFVLMTEIVAQIMGYNIYVIGYCSNLPKSIIIELLESSTIINYMNLIETLYHHCILSPCYVTMCMAQVTTLHTYHQ